MKAENKLLRGLNKMMFCLDRNMFGWRGEKEDKQSSSIRTNYCLMGMAGFETTETLWFEIEASDGKTVQRKLNFSF